MYINRNRESYYACMYVFLGKQDYIDWWTWSYHDPSTWTTPMFELPFSPLLLVTITTHVVVEICPYIRYSLGGSLILTTHLWWLRSFRLHHMGRLQRTQKTCRTLVDQYPCGTSQLLKKCLHKKYKTVFSEIVLTPQTLFQRLFLAPVNRVEWHVLGLSIVLADRTFIKYLVH